MKRIVNRHNEAMEAYDEAMSAKRLGAMDEFRQFAEVALRLETEAALDYAATDDPQEPTRSIFFKGAAVIAMQLNEAAKAVSLAGQGLHACSEPVLRNERVSIIKQAHFVLTLAESDGVEISSNKFNFSIDGSDVGNGFAREDVFKAAFDSFITLVKRTYQRLQGVKFNSASSKSASLPIFVSVPIAGSFAVDVHLGDYINPELDGFKNETNLAATVEDVVICLEAVEENNLAVVRERIQDDVYYANFVALARKLRPKNEGMSIVKVVGKTKIFSQSAVLTNKARSIQDLLVADKKQEHTVEVRGLLRVASKKGQGREVVEICDREGIWHRAHVPEELMADIVRPLWDKRVVAVIKKSPRGRGYKGDLVECEEDIFSSD